MSTPPQWRKMESLVRQWIKFNTVGAMGIIIQLMVLSSLLHSTQMSYLPATFFGVETAILHNFVWHEHWTWAHRVHSSNKEMLRRLLKFNCTTGLFSILGNLLFMRIFVGVLRLPIIPANLLAIATCNLLNFAISEWFVFRTQKC